MRSNRIFKFIAENYIAQATSILDETKVDESCKHSSDAKTRNPIRNSIQGRWFRNIDDTKMEAMDIGATIQGRQQSTNLRS